MIFWLIASALTFVACLAVLLPFMRTTSKPAAHFEHDLEVYRDQLNEVERDAARGLIAPVEAEQARAEIGRRILAVHDLDPDKGPSRRKRQLARLAAAAGVVSIPLVSWGVYAAVGSPELPDAPLSARLERNPAESSAEELLARAEQHLRANPEDGRGWDVLAPIYLRAGRHEDAATAFRNAIRINGSSAAREGGLGEAQTRAAGGIVTVDAQASFERAHQLDARDGRARFFLALARQQEAKTDESAKLLNSMVAELDPSDPWRAAAQDALTRIAAPRGPSKPDLDAASDMTDAQRSDMIASMVQSLDQRLRSQPDDLEGWQRLVQSYVVLGRKDEAAEALRRGIFHYEGRPEAETLTAFSASLGVAPGSRQ